MSVKLIVTKVLITQDYLNCRWVQWQHLVQILRVHSSDLVSVPVAACADWRLFQDSEDHVDGKYLQHKQTSVESMLYKCYTMNENIAHYTIS